MKHIENTVFISYRRTNVPWALAVYQHLTHHGYDVFIDYSGVASGDFERVILENLRARAHFLVLLAPSALQPLHEPGDWLRREIECAMEERRNVVPLFLEGFDIGATTTARQLPGKLADLRCYHGLSVPADYFDAAMEKLRSRYLSVPLDAVLHPASAEAIKVATAQQRTATKAPTVAPTELAASAWFEKGFAAIDPEEKLRCYTEALQLNPDFAAAYYNRGLIRHAQGDLEGALADDAEALRLDPEHADYHYARGILHKDQGDLAGALADYAEALRLNPEHADYHYARGILRKCQGDLAGALADYTEALRLNPEYAFAYNNRGVLRQDQGDLAGALADYAEALRLNPDFAAAYNNRGILRKAQGDLEGALADYTEVLRLNPDFAAAYNNRGLLRQAQGDLDGALADYTVALHLDPEHVRAYYNRASIRQVQGHHGEAILDFEKYLELGGGRLRSDQAQVEVRIRRLRRRQRWRWLLG